MARTNDIQIKEQREFVVELSKQYSKQTIEELFGITIKIADKDEMMGVPRYNLYHNGKLVFALLYWWEIEDIASSLSRKLFRTLGTDAPLDSNMQEAQKMADELEVRELANEKSNYEECLTCGMLVRKGTHFHI